jgi:hypothetical protein
VVFLRGSLGLKYLNLLSDSFPIGQISPYNIILTTNQPNSIFTEDYFQTESTVIRKLLNTQAPEYIDSTSITAVSYFQGVFVSYNRSQDYRSSTSVYYNTSTARAYRVSAASLPNIALSTSLISIETVVQPTSEKVLPFILHVRSILKSFSSNPVVPSLPVDLHLFGGYTSTYDVQMTLFKLVPIMITTTVVVVVVLIGVTFGSVGMPIRLAVTVFIGLCWTYGLTVSAFSESSGVV